ncbi:MAG: hypothetical protein AAB913_02950 [Patescibacteria group bacterium]
MKNKKLVVGLVLAVIVFIGVYLLMRNNCINKIFYTPAVDVTGALGTTKTEEFYYIKKSISFVGNLDKFKTRNEAISSCLNGKLSSDN